MKPHVIFKIRLKCPFSTQKDEFSFKLCYESWWMKCFLLNNLFYPQKRSQLIFSWPFLMLFDLRRVLINITKCTIFSVITFQCTWANCSLLINFLFVYSSQLDSSPNTDVLRKFVRTTEIQSNLYIWKCPCVIQFKWKNILE